MRKSGLIVLFIFLISELFCCTLGVINGSATADGRPILWKSREAGTNVQVMHEDGYAYEYIGSGNSGSEYVWMGMNESGLAIANALSGDLQRLPGNGDCMLQALRNYSTVAEFLTFLDSTNVSGRETHTNYVMMDATGAAVVLEVAPNDYWVFDTADTEYGFLIRDNFSITGGGNPTFRYTMMNHVLADLAQTGPIQWEDIFPQIIRGFYDEEENLLDVPYEDRWDIDSPYGYLSTAYSNNGNSFSSVTLMHGAAPDEPAWLSTMWTNLGVPVSGIALPYWAVCPAVPLPATGDPSVPLTNRAAQIRQMIYNSSPANFADTWLLRNQYDTGYWDVAGAFEQEHFAQINELRDEWINNPPTINELQQLEDQICNEGYQLVMDWDLQPDVTANFAADITQGEAPLLVHFTDLTLHDPDSLAWSFNGDEVIDSIMVDSLGLGVDWVYEEPGEYTVTLIAVKDEMVYTQTFEDYIIVDYPDVDYLAAGVDTIAFEMEEPYQEEFYLYNIGNYPVELQNILITDLEGYTNPVGVDLFWWEFTDENLELPLQLAAGDSCQIRLYPFMPTREYWGQTLVIEADLDTLCVPCLYNEELWNNEDEDVIEPALLYLRNYPNPFNPSTTISFFVPHSGRVELAIYNQKSQKVKSLLDQIMDKGDKEIAWSGKNEQDQNCSSGIYLIKLNYNDQTRLIKRCILLK